MKRPAAKLRKHKKPQTRPAAAKDKTPAQDLLNMDEAIEMLKTTRPTFYRWLRAGKIKGYKVGRQWRFKTEDIERFLGGQQPRVDVPVSPAPLIAELESQLASAGHKTGRPQYPDDPISEAVYLMIKLAFHQRASDVHLGPHHDGSGLLRHRIDGVLHTAAKIDGRLLPALVERWKTMSALKADEKRLPQDGRMKLDVDGAELDIRVSTVPSYGGESLAGRLLRRDALTFEIGKLGYCDADERRLTEAVRSPFGLVIVNGPTGTGKTTVLYSCLGMLAGPQVKIMTVEDPVECLLPWTVPVQINPSAGLTFARAIRSFLRSAPNVIMVGEIRNLEVAELCVQAAITGHMVFTTLHAEDSAKALGRLAEMGVAAFVIADAIRLLVSQRLIRKLCPHCSKPAKLTSDQEALIAEVAASGGLSVAKLQRQFRQPVGCAKCTQTGYSGRTVIAETMKMTPALARALREKASVDELRRIAVSEGMTTMAADGVRRAAAGVTTLQEVQRVLAMSAVS